MWLTVEHITRYGYDAPINEAYTEVRLKPLHRDGQRCSSFVLATEPRGTTVDEYLDRYGNTVHHFDSWRSTRAWRSRYGAKYGRRPRTWRRSRRCRRSTAGIFSPRRATSISTTR